MRKRSGAVLERLTSLRLTIACLILLMALVTLCTLDQVHIGVFGAVEKYFRSFFLYARLPGLGWSVPVFPAGGMIGLALLVNAAAVLAFRLKRSGRNIGLWLIHVGICLLVLGEFVTGTLAVETELHVREGETRDYTESAREDELVLIDHSAATHDRVYAVSESMLARGKAVMGRGLPFELKIKDFFENAALGDRPAALPGSVADRGAGPRLVLRPLKAGGASNMRSHRAAFVEVMDCEQSLGTWLLSSLLRAPQFFEHEGRSYSLAIRPRRHYLPFSITLKDFRHDVYPGTSIPRNFSSLVRLRHPQRGEDRDVLIYMNHPLRYEGKAFYQASYGEEDTLSILQVVENPGWLMPYLSFVLVALGLVVHFLGRMKGVKLAASCLLLGAALPLASPAGAEEFDVKGFGELPVLHGGRIKPLDTVARNSLLMLRGKQKAVVDGRRVPAIEWLLELAAGGGADAYEVFVIDDPDLLGHMGKDRKHGRYFSFSELEPFAGEIVMQAGRVGRRDGRELNRFGKAVVELARRIDIHQRLRHSLWSPGSEDPVAELRKYEAALAKGERPAAAQRYRTLARAAYFKAVPPAPGTPDNAWMSVGEALLAPLEGGKSRPGVAGLAGLAAAYRKGDAAAFNRDLAAYRGSLASLAPDAARHAGSEALFNRLQLFTWGMALYLLAFLLACVSWLGGRERLRDAVFWVLVAGLSLHTLGLLGRMLLQGRPPVTNLYSSAVFVGWVAALLSIALERMDRRGIAGALGGAVGFCTLVVAHHLAMSGDTMEMMQAVLDSNFWLATHVVTIIIGYGATYLAGAFAHVYIFLRAAGRLDRETGSSLARMTYGVVCFALLFTFVGTVLGGIWADQSWGRFWGWDPKENGALLMVLWQSVMLHARRDKWFGERGFMTAAVFGNVITSVAWFGVNMLGVGLHSYGFMDKAFFWLTAFTASQLAVMALAALPPLRRRRAF